MNAEVYTDIRLSVSMEVGSKSEDVAKEEATNLMECWSHGSLILYDYHSNKHEFRVNDLKALLDSLEYFTEDE